MEMPERYRMSSSTLAYPRGAVVSDAGPPALEDSHAKRMLRAYWQSYQSERAAQGSKVKKTASWMLTNPLGARQAISTVI